MLIYGIWPDDFEDLSVLLLFITRDVHFRQKMQSVITQMSILTFSEAITQIKKLFKLLKEFIEPSLLFSSCLK